MIGPPDMHRRDVLSISVSAAAASVFCTSSVGGADAQEQFQITDSNVSLFHWPFRRLPLDDVNLLLTKLRSLDITQAWAGSFEGVLHRDIAAVNRRLASVCRKHSDLVPIGSINPMLPGWENDLRACHEEYDMPGVRLHPNYHGYTLDDPRFGSLLQQATSAGCFVQIAVAMEDTRTQHEKLRVADVDLTTLPEVVARVDGARVQMLNHRLRGTLLAELAATPGIYFDTARVDSTDGVPTLMKNVPPGRVLFGTHAPFLIPEAALIRVHESDQLDATDLRDVLAKNAKRLVGGRTG